MKRAASFAMADRAWLAEMNVTVPGADTDAVEAEADPDPVAVSVTTPQSMAAGPVAVAGPPVRPVETVASVGR